MARDDELEQLMRGVHEMLGEDAYDNACMRAMAAAQESEPKVDGDDPAERTVDVGLNESHLILESVYRECLLTELRRLVRPH